MKKLKKAGALLLAFVMVLSFMPMMNEVKAADAGVTDYYRFWFGTSGKTVEMVTEGTPVVSGVTVGSLTPTGASAIYASDYKPDGITSISAIKVGSNSYGRARKMGGSNYLTFTAPCDGVVEYYCRPTKTVVADNDVNVLVNDEVCGETMTLPSGLTAWNQLGESGDWKFEWKVTKGESYKISSSAETAAAELAFFPAPVSALGASYRASSPEYGNGIRFGSEIDKTAIDYAKVTESGTLVALKDTMTAKSVAELTMDTVDTVSKKVVRTTYLTDDDTTLKYAAAIVNIPENQKDTVFVARSYVVIDGTTYYGYQIEGTWNSVNAAVNP